MRYFIFYKNESIVGKGCAIVENTIEEWLKEEGAKEVSQEKYESINVLDFKTFRTVRYRMKLGACTNCKADYTNSEQWCDEYVINSKHICGNCQIGTVPVLKILAIQEN